jgi:CubicO group peptidase (beta-lactamase class C family)
MHALLLALILQGPVDSAVRIVMQSQHVAGLSLGIARHGQILYLRGYGERDAMRHLDAQPQTVYRIGSLTKMFTARAILTLAARHKLALSRPAAAYIPNFPWGSAVTVDELLAQRSGIPSYTDQPLLNPYAWYAPAQLVASVANQPLLFAPGSHYAYSNTNYVLLGMIAQRLAHEQFEDYVNGHVIAPLRLRHTRYGDQPGESLGYRWDGETFMRATPTQPAYAFSAAALSSNVPDVLRFLQTLSAPYYGLQQSESLGTGVWYARGNVDGYSAFAFVIPKTGDEAVILCNADRVDLAPLALDIVQALEPSDQRAFGPPQNEDLQLTARVHARAVRLFAPLQIALIEFLGRQTAGQGSVVDYRVTLSDGSRLLLHVPVDPHGTIGEITVLPQ